MKTNYLKKLSFAFMTVIPAISYWWQMISKIDKEMNIFEFYSENISTLVFMLILGLVIATLGILYWNLIDFTKKRNKEITSIKKALVDHAIRLTFFRDVIFRLTVKQETTDFDSISTIGDDQKIYLGFNENQINSKDKFEMPDLEKPLFYKDHKHWELLKDDFNSKNNIIR